MKSIQRYVLEIYDVMITTPCIIRKRRDPRRGTGSEGLSDSNGAGKQSAYGSVLKSDDGGV
jgi:hypothetical protein